MTTRSLPFVLSCSECCGVIEDMYFQVKFLLALLQLFNT